MIKDPYLTKVNSLNFVGFDNGSNNYSFEADNSRPVINVMSLVSSNIGKDYDNQSIKVAMATLIL